MRAKKIDANQNAIVKSLRQIPGVVVAITSMVGNGFPDLLIARRRGGKITAAVLVELKDGQKPASRKKLTPAEEKFKAEWKGNYYVCESLEDCLKIIGL